MRWQNLKKSLEPKKRRRENVTFGELNKFKNQRHFIYWRRRKMLQRNILP